MELILLAITILAPDLILGFNITNSNTSDVLVYGENGITVVYDYETQTAISTSLESTSITAIDNNVKISSYSPNTTEDTNIEVHDNHTSESHNGTKSINPRIAKIKSVFIKLIYVLGIAGNAGAIVCLNRGERRVRNKKHLLLLTSLAANDLVALVGMLSSRIVDDLFPERTQALCAAYVVLRVFGIGSVCIAVTMALERYLALTRVFLYQKRVTYFVIRWALAASWVFAALLTCLPIAGVGLYWEPRRRVCLRYREATLLPDRVYAAFYVAFGTALCVVLVYCNLAVILALYRISAPGAGPPAVRRYSHASARRRHAFNGMTNAATAEEVAFSRLMATLSVLFVICWLPQMLSSVLYLAIPKPSSHGWVVVVAITSDMLMLLNYVINPIVYVLSRQRRNICQTVVDCFKRRHRSSHDSMKTSYCPDTVMLSDSSVAGTPLAPPAPAAPPAAPLVCLAPDKELQPLRPLPPQNHSV